MNSSKFAWVTGAKPRYTLHLSREARELGFEPLHRLEFPRYRAAQDLANFLRKFSEKEFT